MEFKKGQVFELPRGSKILIHDIKYSIIHLLWDDGCWSKTIASNLKSTSSPSDIVLLHEDFDEIQFRLVYMNEY